MTAAACTLWLTGDAAALAAIVRNRAAINPRPKLDERVGINFGSAPEAASLPHATCPIGASAVRLETKFIPLEKTGLDLKVEAGQPVRIAGWASIFNLVDNHNDVVARGAYADTLAEWKALGRMPRMLLDHQGLPIGRWTELREETKGLWVEGELTPGMRLAEDVAASLRHGAIDGLSIGYRAKRYDIAKGSGTRTLSQLHLGEVSIVGNPANVEARVTDVKSADDILTLRQFETFLRGHGWSRREAEIIAGQGFKSLASRDGDDEHDDPDPRDEAKAVKAATAATSLLDALKALRLTP